MTKITKPGVYDLTMEEYHGDCCDGPSVSASVLHKIGAECPAKMWAVSPLNRNRFPDKEKKEFNFGKAAHALSLGEPNFYANFFVVPDGAPNRPSKKQRNAKKPSQETLDAIEFWDDVALSKKTIVSEEDFVLVSVMSEERMRSPQCARSFQNGVAERSLICRDPETGIWLKVRPDWLPNDPERAFIEEYKTARSIQPDLLGSAVFNYGYEGQAALQYDVAEIVLGIKPLGIAHICQEKEPPCLAELKMFDIDQLEWGRKNNRKAIRLFARCWEAHLAGKPERVAWPGYTVNAEYFRTPYRVRKAMESPDEFDRYADAGRAATASEFYAPL